MKKIYLIFLLLPFAFSCSKNSGGNNSPTNQDTLVDQLSSIQIQAIEAAGVDSTSKYKDAQFSDGTNMSDWETKNDSGYIYIFNLRANPASDKRLLFINAMTHAGFQLITRSNYSFPNQKGLAYVYNSKTFSKPSIYPKATCQDSLFGLDCSGMIYQMANAGGLNLPRGGTSDYVNTSVWNNAFNNSPDFKGLEMRDTGTLDVSKIEAGDIIVAPYVHIGMVFFNGSSLAIFNSLGTSTYSCAKNSDTYHGPVISKNLSAWLQQSFGSTYHVLRVIQNGAPGISTNDISAITENAATSGGNITDDGGSNITARGVCWSTSVNPTVNDSKTSDGEGAGNFTSSITNLTANTTYHVRAYAINALDIGYGKDIVFTTGKEKDSTFADQRDGQVYTFKHIGSQVWMAMNLNYASSNSWCYDCAIYGRLYNWNAALSAAPSGWHLPTDAEWETLSSFLGGDATSGGALKATQNWSSPNLGATNSSGFTAFGGGFKDPNGVFGNLGGSGTFWTATATGGSSAWYRGLHSDATDLRKTEWDKGYGFSVRCIRD